MAHATNFIYRRLAHTLRCPNFRPQICKQISKTFSSDSMTTSKATGHTASSGPLVHLSNKNIDEFVDKFDNFLLDCDGVLWGADHYTRFKYTAETIESLRSKGKNVIFVTNNSMRSREECHRKLLDYGGFDTPLENIFAATFVAAAYLKNVLKAQGKCYIIGGSGLRSELMKCGFEVFGVGPDTDPVSEHVDVLLAQHFEPDIQAVIVGFDPFFSYSKMLKAASYLSDPKCHFIGTSDLEGSIWIGPNRLQPVTGAIIDAVATGAQRKPVIVGKPHSQLWDSIKSQHPDLDITKSVFIGDTTKTDVCFANNLGMSSALVLTGGDDMQDVDRHVKNNQNLNVPNYILPKFCNLGAFF